MNLNRALFILFGILIVLVALTVFQVVQSKSASIEYVYADDDVLMTNILCTPEIVRSYENAKDVFVAKDIFFFRYAYNSCSSCINGYLAETLALQEEIGKEHIWIFPAYPDDRGSRLQLSAELAKFNYRNIPADSLLIPTINDKQKPYFGWINSEGKIEMVFSPDINNRLYTSKFFIEVKRVLSLGSNLNF